MSNTIISKSANRLFQNLIYDACKTDASYCDPSLLYLILSLHGCDPISINFSRSVEGDSHTHMSKSNRTLNNCKVTVIRKCFSGLSCTCSDQEWAKVVEPKLTTYGRLYPALIQSKSRRQPTVCLFHYYADLSQSWCIQCPAHTMHSCGWQNR